MTTRIAALIVPALAMWLAAGCGKPNSQANVLARVGQSVITEADFASEVAYRRSVNQSIPAKETLLDEMIQQRALVQKALAAGLDKDPDVRRAEINALIGKLKEKQLQPNVKRAEVRPGEVRQAYERNLARYSKPAQMKFALLCLKTDALTSPERVNEISAQLERARLQAAQLPADTRGFGALAIENSEDQMTRYKGGDIGWLNEGEPTRWPTNVIAAGFALSSNGAVSEVVRAQDGLYVVRRVDSRPAEVTPFEQVQDAIRHRLLTEKRQQLERTFLSETRREQGVVINASALAALPAPPTQMVKQIDVQPPSLP